MPPNTLKVRHGTLWILHQGTQSQSRVDNIPSAPLFFKLIELPPIADLGYERLIHERCLDDRSVIKVPVHPVRFLITLLSSVAAELH